MGEVRVWSHNVNLTFYRLTSLSFHVNGPSHSPDSAFSNFDLENPRSRSWVRWTLKVTTWVQHPIDSRPFSFHVNRPSHCCDTAFSKSDLENPRSRSWVRWTLKVTTWVQHSTDSHPFCSISIGHPITEIRLFQNLTLKIQGQGQGVRWKLKVTTWVQYSIDSHPFHSMSIGHAIPEIRLFQNLTLKIQGQGHGWGERWKSQHGSNILSTHIHFIPCQSAMPFLRYDFFKIWPWKSKVKVMGEVNIESHNMGPTFYRLTSLSFHVKRPCHSWLAIFSKLDLGNPRSRSWLRSKLKVPKVGVTSYQCNI